MKTLIALVSMLALTRAQQQLIDPYFNEGLVQYNDWQPIPGPNVAHPYAVPQFLPAQQYPLLQQVPAVQLPQVPVPFPAQLPLPYLQPGQYPYQLPLPPQPQQLLPGLALPPFNMAQLPPQVQVVRHGLPHSDAAAVSYSSLNYNNNNNNAQPATLQTPPVVGVSSAPATGVNSAAAVPVAPNAKVSVVKDIATFGTEYGTGADKTPVARYEAINAGSVHVAPLPGHTVDQKLIAPGTADQKL
ncbi:E1A-binding protein p400-like [Anopheles stephensi]|uniref:E1A-binding protein p400-like n=1 Tax=Anopheles stephensi TaxID=30069 RepID=UPI001658AE11|nr:E1A-binding protein p400-like [Anopheles stephensi]